MRNDHKGLVRIDTSLLIDTFYASGSRGDETRADGNGNLLPRGYYAQSPRTGLIGPVKSRQDARDAAYIVSRSYHRLGRDLATNQ